MIDRRLTCSVLLLAFGVAVARPGPAGADDDAWLEVTENRAEFSFAERLVFTLEAQGELPVEEVLLRYRVEGDLPTNRRVPEYTPGTEVAARHEERLARGQIPPAATISWWWTVTDASGRVADTPPSQSVYLDQRFDWRQTDVGDVRVWWYGDNADVAKSVAQAAGEVLDRLDGVLGPSSQPEVDIVAYAGQGDMRSALADRGETYESRLATLGARVAPHILLLDVTTRPGEVSEILAHELSHLVLHNHFEQDYVEAPLWLDEGLAMYAEGPLDRSERSLLDDAIREDTIMSVRSLTSFPGQADLVPLAYAQSRDIVAFLIDSQGNGAFRDLVTEIGSGKSTPDEALQAVYGMDQSALYQAYRQAQGLGAAATPAAPRVRRRTAAPGGAPCPAATVAPTTLLALAFVRRRRRAETPSHTCAAHLGPREPGRASRAVRRQLRRIV